MSVVSVPVRLAITPTEQAVPCELTCAWNSACEFMNDSPSPNVVSFTVQGDVASTTILATFGGVPP